MGECDLRAANGMPHDTCDGAACPFWRAVEQLGDATGEGCAIKHYELLGDKNVAAWLLTVKQRMDRETQDAHTRP